MSIARIAGINLAVLVASLAAAEAFLWLFAPIAVDEPKDVEIEILQSHAGVKPRILYTESRFQYRSTSIESPHERQADLRLLCLGASTTKQETQETKDMWCSQLGDQLQAESGRSVESAAMAQSGWKAVDLLYWVNQNISDYRPDIAVVLMGVNDVALAGGPDYSYRGLEDALARRALAQKQIRSAREQAKSVSQIARRAVLLKRRLYPESNGGRLQFGWSSEHMPALRAKLQSLPYSDHPERSADPIEEFGDAINSVIAALTNVGAKVIVAGQPVIWKPSMTKQEQQACWFAARSATGEVRASGRWLQEEMRRFNGMQKEIAESHGQTFVDLQSKIPSSLEIFYDDCHFTDAGSALIARELLPAALAVVKSVSRPREPRM